MVARIKMDGRYFKWPREQPSSAMYDRYYQIKKDAAREIYTERPLIYSPFFKQDILLGSEGFQHLSVSAKGGRSREEQIQRFTVLPFGIHILETATTLRGYRRRFDYFNSTEGDERSRRDRLAVGASGMFASKKRKIVQWWRFAEPYQNQGMVRVVVRKIGNGNLHFWSVMLNADGPGYRARNVPIRNLHEVPASRIHVPNVANAA